jgi:hypothetical protein
MAYHGNAVVLPGKIIGLLLHMETPVGAAGGGDVPDADGLEKIPEAEAYQVVKIRINPGRLVAVIHIDGDKPRLNPYRVVQGIGIMPFKDQIFVVVTQSLEKPAFRGKAVKHLVYPGPFGAYVFEGELGQFFDVSVQNQMPAALKVVVFQDLFDYFPVGLEIVPPP